MRYNTLCARPIRNTSRWHSARHLSPKQALDGSYAGPSSPTVFPQERRRVSASPVGNRES
ncbi:hypothetical protein HMPREF1549_01820 [Actinomyces johnsonii F0510]|uniref:Uncharacterized protein n=1 Tax=Actinomyces johnsonii F0510 TaxID=1227262 RepID=U1Q8D2_9ACTO|nr:hypothetical protein HMPREF1549_01820 [Actinomyces johnsonii F0510]